MNSTILLISFLMIANTLIGQNDFQSYNQYIKKADSLLFSKDYEKAAKTYSLAFESIGWKGAQKDRYNAACSWANFGNADSAFYQLDNIVTKAKYSDFEKISTDPNFISLRDDKRWGPLLSLVKENKEKLEAKYNKPLMTGLEDVFYEDQKYREQMDSVQKSYGWDSREMKSLMKLIGEKDSINLIKVKSILDKNGWLGPETVGARGSLTLFLVIQHADLPTQKKYLPMMREAAKNNKLQKNNLALIEDRVALREGQKQIYGSQIGRDPKTGNYFIFPLTDPDNVDKRRVEMGLPPLADYVAHWEIHWDIEQYKKELPMLEEKVKSLNP
ncbi:MAG: hypothetical protein JST58_16150 [Bacteroidetes bacterium]|nr:hypothetical protein [Bacteroidota bacterium]